MTRPRAVSLPLLLWVLLLAAIVGGSPLPEATAWAPAAGSLAVIADAAGDNGADRDDDDDRDGDDDEEGDEKSGDGDQEAGDDAVDDAGGEQDNEEDADAGAAPEARKTATVAAKPLKLTVTVDGAFVARNMSPVTLQPEAWTAFKINKIVPHGARVNRGDVLVEFDDKKLEEAIADLELSQRLSDLALRQAEEELPRLERSLEMSLTDAKQTHKQINDDYKRYKETDRDRYIESQEMSLKSSRRSLDYARDELEQLEKMYQADDLTEETEEIILTRQRQSVEMAEYRYKEAKLRYERALSISLPRQDVEKRETVERAEMTLERAKLSAEISLNKARYELQQKRVSREKSNERHAKLVQDRGLMEVKAPVDGIVYYGRCVSGKWADMSTMMTKLLPEKSVTPGTVMMTVIDPAELYLTATVAEKDRPTIAPGQPAEVTLSASGAAPLEGSVESVSLIPVSSGKFGLEVTLAGGDRPEWLVPGMTGKIKVTTYDKEDALLVAKKAVRTDDDDNKYVWLVTGEGGAQGVEKRAVEVGQTKGDSVEILGGLEAGDVVSLEDESKEESAD